MVGAFTFATHDDDEEKRPTAKDSDVKIDASQKDFEKLFNSKDFGMPNITKDEKWIGLCYASFAGDPKWEVSEAETFTISVRARPKNISKDGNVELEFIYLKIQNGNALELKSNKKENCWEAITENQDNGPFKRSEKLKIKEGKSKNGKRVLVSYFEYKNVDSDTKKTSSTGKSYCVYGLHPGTPDTWTSPQYLK